MNTEMRNILLLLFILFTTSLMSSQNPGLSEKITDQLKSENQEDTLDYYNQKIASTNDSAEVADLYFKLGKFCYDNYYLDSAEECFLVSADLFKSFNEDEKTIESLNLLGITENMLSKYDEALSIQKEILSLSLKIENNSFTSRALGKIGVVYYYMSNSDSALNYFSKAIDIASKDRDSTSLAVFYNNSAIVYDEISDYENAWNYYSKSLEISKGINDTTKIVTCYNNMAIILETEGKYDEAAEYYLKAINIVVERNDKERIAMYKANYAYIFELQEMYNEALKIQKECLDINRKLGLPFRTANSLQNIGRVYGKMDSLAQAYKAYGESNKIYDEINRPAGKAINFINMGTLLQKEMKFIEAISLYKQAEKIVKENNDTKNLAACFTNMSSCYYQLNELDNALYYGQKAFDLANDLGVVKIQADVSATLSNVFEKKADFRNSLKYRKVNQELNDSLMNEEKIRKIAQLESKLEYEKELSIDKLKQKDLQMKLSSESMSKKFYVTTTMLGAVIVIVMGYFYQSNKRKNISLLRKNLELLRTDTTKGQVNVAKEKYSSSKLSTDEVKRIKNLFLKNIADNEIWRDPKINVTDIAKAIETNSTYLSQIINSEFGINFTNFINEYRIKEAEKMIISGFSKTMTFEALAEQCGFNSRATFYNAFKKTTGLTPSNFDRLINLEKSETGTVEMSEVA